MKIKNHGGAGISALKIAAKDLSGKKIKVGWTAAAKYKEGVSVAEVAITNEFGAPRKGIPPRPFVRPTIDGGKKNWDKIISRQCLSIFDGKIKSGAALEQIALTVEGDLKKSLIDVSEPKLKESTISARIRKGIKHKDPLRETGIMLSSITSEVTN